MFFQITTHTHAYNRVGDDFDEIPLEFTDFNDYVFINQHVTKERTGRLVSTGSKLTSVFLSHLYLLISKSTAIAFAFHPFVASDENTGADTIDFKPLVLNVKTDTQNLTNIRCTILTISN